MTFIFLLATVFLFRPALTKKSALVENLSNTLAMGIKSLVFVFLNKNLASAYTDYD